MTGPLRIGTRGSKLAVAQSQWVQTWLRQHRNVAVELVTIRTTGDRFAEQPVSHIGGKGVFVKEIEDALLAGSIDCAVHSMKDVPSELAPGLIIAAVPAREDPRDVLISAADADLPQLPRGARVGTSSLRRAAQLRAARADLDVRDLRGNVDTRLRKLGAGEFDALVLAAAGLRRLGIRPPGTQILAPEIFIPAIGQGALAIESRQDEVADLFAPLDDTRTHVAVTAERAFLRRTGGTCHTPLAAHATVESDTVELRAMIASPDGTRVVRGTRTGPASSAAKLATDLADELLGRGGAAILQALETS